MSFLLMKNLRSCSPSRPTPRTVLITLAMFANDEGGSCFPSLVRLSVETKYSTRTITRAISCLESEGWITVVRRGGGRSNSVYQINLEKIGGSNVRPCRQPRPVAKVESEEHPTSCQVSIDKMSAPLEPHIGVPVIKQSFTPPLTPPAGGERVESLDLAQVREPEFDQEQQEHLEGMTGKKRQQWEEHYRRENEEIRRQEQAEHQAREEDARLRAEMPTVEKARDWTMRRCRVQLQGRPRPRGIEWVVEYAIREDGRDPHQAALAICAAWEKFKNNIHQMKYTYGFVKFIRLGLCFDERLWPWDREQMRLRSAASVGTMR